VRQRRVNGVRLYFGDTGAIWLIGIGAQSVSLPPHDGCCNPTPRLPHAVQRPCRRSMSGQPSGPHRMRLSATSVILGYQTGGDALWLSNPASPDVKRRTRCGL
jgi:hypothetical protein